MKARNMTSSTGRAIPNQIIFVDDNGNEFFQSYDSIIVKIEWSDEGRKITLDSRFWDYSTTTGKYRNAFLGETKAETQARIDSGEYKLADLNS